jgi:alpha-mannosidase
MFATFHPEGILPQSDSFLSVEPESVMATVLKQAEDVDGLVLRAFETSGAVARATIRLPKLGRVIEADFGVNEIKTFLIPHEAAEEVTETNLLEWQDG